MFNIINNYKHFYWSSKFVVTMGFVSLLALMVLLASIGLSRMAQNNHRMEFALSEQNTKTAVVTSMRNIARERVVLLFTAIVLSDEFDRDEAVMRFRQLANDFVAARAQFFTAKLSPDEARQFTKILETTRVAAAYQRQVANLISEGRLSEAKKLLVEIAVPAQNELITAYDEFLNLQTRVSKNSILQANKANHATYAVMVILVAIAILLGTIVAMFVIRRIARIEDALFEEKELAEITLHSVTEGIITTDQRGRVTYLNPVAEQLTGWPAAEITQQNLDRIYRIVDELTGTVVSGMPLLNRLDGPMVPLGNRVLICRDGRQFSIEDSIAPIRNKEGEVIGTVVVFSDVSEARNLTQKLSWQVSHDPLTGLSNRLEFDSRLAVLLESAQTQGKQHFLLFMDLDQFKLINDTCGHIAGDELLKQLSRTLETAIRGNDTLARLGGDEFGVLLECCPLEHALKIAENIRQLVASFKFMWEERSFLIGVSIGMVPINADSGKEIEIMTLADAACYKAKNDGRNQIQLFEGHDQIVSRRYQTQSVLSATRALEENRFCLYHQQIIPTAASSEAPVHYEILLRMLDETGKLIPPGTFIPVCERYKMMPAIDRWVVKDMFQWLAMNQGLTTRDSVYSINLSGQSLIDASFLDYVIEQMNVYQIAPAQIGFEITETAAIANLSKAVRFISTLKGLGCTFSLDDFGSGMSSYGYLKNLHVDYLKIDGAFVRNMVSDKIDYAMVDSINRIGHVMGIKTIAEFVENEEIYRHLGMLGVDYAQGYGIHKPELLSNGLTLQMPRRA